MHDRAGLAGRIYEGHTQQLWLTCGPRTGPPSGSMSGIASEWVRRYPALTVNIACDPNTSPTQITETVAAVRNVRIGRDARYPDIVVLLPTAPHYTESLAAIRSADLTLPRIRVYPVFTSDATSAVVLEAIHQAQNIGLETRALILHGTSNVRNQFHAATIQDGSSPSIIHEWFLDRHDAVETNALEVLLRTLCVHHYSVLNHPLSLCGGLAWLIRGAIWRKFGSKMSTITTSARHTDDVIARFAQIPCSGAVLQTVLGASCNLRLRCFCQVPYSEAPNWPWLDDIVTQELARVNDEVLFEDWQYIYDGFGSN